MKTMSVQKRSVVDALPAGSGGGLPLAIALLVSLALFSVAGCATDDGFAGAPTFRAAVCVDNDGDGFGFNCSGGTDCDDNDAQVQSGCNRGAAKCDGKEPETGCPCAEGDVFDCGKITVVTTRATLCDYAERKCGEDGVWSGCRFIISTGAGGEKSTP